MIALVAVLSAWSALAGDSDRGRELFRSCQGCHNTASDERKMGPPLRSLFGKVTLRNGKRVDDDNVREIILDGLNGMPSFRYSFRAAEIEDLMAYLHTLTGKPTETAPSTGAAYFKAYCVSCHGTDLRGRFRPEYVTLIEEGHGNAPALKDWLQESERRMLFDYLKIY